MSDNGQTHATAPAFGRVIGLKNSLQLVGRYAGAGVTNGNLNRVVLQTVSFDGEFSRAGDRFARIFEQVYKNLGQMAALHQQGRKIVRVSPLNGDVARDGRREYL